MKMLITNQEVFDQALVLTKKMFQRPGGKNANNSKTGGVTRRETKDLIFLQKLLTRTEKHLLNESAKAFHQQK